VVSLGEGPLFVFLTTRGERLQNDGRTEVLKVLAQDEPPAFIHPGIDGCAYSSTAEPAADGEYVGRLDSRSEEGYFDWL
jgi:hypothetical protein